MAAGVPVMVNRCLNIENRLEESRVLDLCLALLFDLEHHLGADAAWVPQTIKSCHDIDVKSIAGTLRDVQWDNREVFERCADKEVVSVMKDLQISWKQEISEKWRSQLDDNSMEEAWKEERSL